jgi:uncharacterized Tic20 family protein
MSESNPPPPDPNPFDPARPPASGASSYDAPTTPPAPTTDSYDTAPPPPPAPALDATAYAKPPPPAQPLPYAGALGYPGPYIGPPPDQNAKTMGMLCHLLSLAGLIVPLGNFLGPLVIWLVKKQEHPFIDDQGKESLNFQITFTIALFLAGLTFCIAIGIVLFPAVAIAGLVFSIIGGLKASGGEAYRYPFTIRFIK